MTRSARFEVNSESLSGISLVSLDLDRETTGISSAVSAGFQMALLHQAGFSMRDPYGEES